MMSFADLCLIDYSVLHILVIKYIIASIYLDLTNYDNILKYNVKNCAIRVFNWMYMSENEV